MRPEMHGMLRSGGRFILLLVMLVVLWWAIVLIAGWNTPTGVFGWNAGPDGTTLTYVTPGLSADKAGLRAGDRIEWASLPMVGRANLGLVQNVALGTRLTIHVTRGKQTRAVTLEAAPLPPSIYVLSYSVSLSILFVVALAAALVYLRPSRMTWGFMLALLDGSALPPTLGHWGQQSPVNLLLVNGIIAMFAGLSTAGTLMFASRFPRDRAPGALVWLDRAAIPIGAIVAAYGLYQIVVIAFSSAPANIGGSDYVANLTLLGVALVALTANYVTTSGSDRQRVVPVLAAFAFSVAVNVLNTLVNDAFTNTFIWSITFPLRVLATLVLAFAVVHGVLRHRVFDVSFAISKTVVYTAVTSLVVGVFVLIDFASSKLLADLRIALVLEACAALALGIWLNAIHNRIDRFVDRVLFRKRHLAESRLERAARTLPHAQACDYIDEVLVTEACDALDLASAAIFRRLGGSTFARVRAHGWNASDASLLEGDDPLSVVLRAELQPIDLTEIHRGGADFPGGVAQPLIAIPFVARHELAGFVLYGGHGGGEALDPDEQRILSRLAQAAAAAYEYVHATVLADETQRLRTENALLRDLTGAAPRA